MKNKFLKILLILISSSIFFEPVISSEFNFEISEIEILDKGNIYKGANRGKITTDNQIEIISNNFIYLKKINQLEANGKVQLTDFKNDILINADKIIYLKDEKKIYTPGKTTVKISENYTIIGQDLTLLRDKMILSSEKEVLIYDKLSNIYKLSEFQYSINQEILKGKEIKITKKSQERESDTIFFESGFFNLKENKFLAKDINLTFHKTLFNNNKNDPRISAVSGYGDELNTYFEKGIFTSCKKTEKCPPWKISSSKIHHDKKNKKIVYKDAWLEIYDFPVAYFPKFFHPDPSVKRQSGFLTPKLGSSKNLGNSIYTPYFFVISKNKDVTIKPRIFDNNKFILQNEYRQKTKNSSTITDFSIAKGHNSNLDDKNDSRSHFFSNTKVNLNLDNFSNSILEVNYEKTSNDNYLKLFDLESPLLIQNNDVLESKILLDLEHQNYDLTTSFEMYETLEGANSDRYEYILPSYNLSKNFNRENLNGSFNFNSYGNNTLNSTNIFESTILHDLDYISYNSFLDNGVKTNYSVSLKNVNTMGKNSKQYKSSPQSEITSSYMFNTSLPLTKYTKDRNNRLEPKLSFRFSPHDMKNQKGEERRIDITNIYNINRLSLNDTFEGGESITVGFDFKSEKIETKNEIEKIEDYFEFKLATVFRRDYERNMPTRSTLDNKNSNIFGQLNYKPTNNLSLNYDFSINDDLSDFEYNSLNALMAFNNFSTEFDILEEKGSIGDLNIVENTSIFNFSEENSLSFKTRRNRNLNLTEYYNLLYEYKNDCLIAGVQYKKNYYNDSDIKPVEELFFSITIVPLTTLSPAKMSLN